MEMLLRSILLTVMVVIGGASPWLVRDWLRGDLKADLEQTLETLSGPKSNGGPASSPSEGSSGMKSEDALPPYPLARATHRIMQSVLSRGAKADAVMTTPPPTDSANRAATPAEPLPTSRDTGLAAASGASPESAVGAIPSELQALGLTVGDSVFLRLFKKEQELELWMQAEGERDFTLYRVYRLHASSVSPGPKRRDGDRLIPEGFYYQTVAQYREREASNTGREEIDLGYPNDWDRLDPGVSGAAVLAVGASRESACLLSESDMADVKTMIGAAFSSGQMILRMHLFPFRMSDEAMNREWKESSKTADFWMNLKEGYDFFENAGFPPNVTSDPAGYHFSVP